MVVDAGGANLGSVVFALERLGARVSVSADPGEISRAPRVILPGVGSAVAGMARLHQLGLVDVLRGLRQPLLGICLGMQLLYESSDEGDVACLGLLPGRVTRLRGATGSPVGVRVPHMGWNRLHIARPDPLLAGLEDGAHVYFVHSYAAAISDTASTDTTSADTTLAWSEHCHRFAAVVSSGNRCGMQFHPERSGAAGQRLLRNFLLMTGH